MVYMVRCLQDNEMHLLFLKSNDERRNVNKQIQKLFGKHVCSIRRSKEFEKDILRFNTVFA